MQRAVFLDIARGISIIFVILSHIIHVPRWITCWYIPVFFIISGYLYNPEKNYYSIVSSRVKRLIFPYFSYSLLLLLIFIVVKKPSFTDLLNSFLGIVYSRNEILVNNPNGINTIMNVWNSPMWFLTASFSAGLLFYAIAPTIIRNKVFLFLYLVFSFILTQYLNSLEILLPWSIDMVCLYSSFMFLGYSMKLSNIFYSRYYWLILLTIPLYLWISKIGPSSNYSIGVFEPNNFLGILCTFIIGGWGSMVILSISKLFEKINVISSFWSYLGKQTIPLLSLHILGISIAKSVLNFSQAFIDTSFFVKSVFIIVFSISFCLFFTWLRSYLFQLILIERKKHTP